MADQLPDLAAIPAWPAGLSAYPTSLDVFSEVETAAELTRNLNDVTAAVAAIEATLGADPAGTYHSIKAALGGLRDAVNGLQGEVDAINVVPGPPNTFFRFSQMVPSSLWDITHNLGRKTAVTVTDSAGSPVEGEVEYVSNNRLTVAFSAPFAGEATLS